MHHFKILNGTPNSSEKNLCKSCSSAHTFKLDTGKETIICQSGRDFEVEGKVVECSEYHNKTIPSLSAMKDTAWILRTSASGQAVGFMNNKDFRSKYGEEDLDRI